LKWKRTLEALLLLGVLILAFNIQQTQSLYPPPTEWTRTYGISGNHDEARSIIKTIDGGYAMLGFTQHWETGWAYTSDFWLVKTDTAGNVEWNRTYGAPTSDYLESGVSVVQTDDGGYVMTGGTRSYGAGKTDVYLVKTDSTGNLQWNQTYGGTYEDWGVSMVRTSDGGYAMAGRAHAFLETHFWLVKTCSGGDVNGDSAVDIFDLSIVGRAYFTFIGDPDYDPDADLNEDGLVDMRDPAIVALNYGIG